MQYKLLLLLLFLLLCFLKVEGNYRVGFFGLPSREIYETMQEVSTLVAAQKNAPPTFYTLKRRAEGDLPLFLDVLRAVGYFDAKISLQYQGEFPNTTVCIMVCAGPCYRFTEMKIEDSDGHPLPLCVIENLELQPGAPARFDVILNTEEQIALKMGCLGYPFAKVVAHHIVADQAAKTLSVTYVVESGAQASFGEITLQGLCRVKPAFIWKKLSWCRGELFNPLAIECTDAALQEAALFSMVQITPGRVQPDGSLEMIIQVCENKYRHFGAGVSYSTDESVGGVAQWSHDNLTGMGDSFSLIAEVSEIIKRGTMVYNRPDFLRRHQDLTYSLEVRQENAPGFTERELSLLIRVGRRVNPYLFYSYGGRYEHLLSTKSDNNEDYNLFSIPLHLRIDTTDRLLEQRTGFTFNYWGTPHKAMFNSHILFLKQEIFAALFQPLLCKPEIILALSAQLGSITGQSRILIPAPKRFYAGSSTGLRGYKYLTVSPLDGTKPIGGRSLLIFQLEPRVRIIEKLYGVFFFDCGNVYSPSFPQLDEKFLRSYGGGIRYLTPVGAFRLDIGFPLDKRKGIDHSFQIYASIGQVF